MTGFGRPILIRALNALRPAASLSVPGPSSGPYSAVSTPTQSMSTMRASTVARHRMFGHRDECITHPIFDIRYSLGARDVKCLFGVLFDLRGSLVGLCWGVDALKKQAQDGAPLVAWRHATVDEYHLRVLI